VIDDLEAGDGFRAMFADEANERIDSMVATLLELENGQATADTIDSLFRDTHTIKGGAGMLGLDDVGTLAHAIEDLLENVRGATAVPPELADMLLRATDALRLHVTEDGADSAALLAELRTATGDAPPGADASCHFGACNRVEAHPRRAREDRPSTRPRGRERAAQAPARPRDHRRGSRRSAHRRRRARRR
jgi:two-component system chemotaxis sensor kinase CheA